ncbi:hypothetical protein Taro_032884 [Colocasia esculenta]|uniref:Uncharacterized protein n=1 Tax=Colocasia esculenta TaxID=4460 RepID=A0A843W7F1_COLES|nr:hypothetical protein [Colocasia esculenta]
MVGYHDQSFIHENHIRKLTRGRVKHIEWKVTPHDLHETQFHVNTRKGWYTMHHHKSLPTQGTGTYYHKVPARKPQHTTSHNGSHNCANTRAHLEWVKPRLRVTNSRTTASGKARVGKERRHHTGTDYWLIRPVSKPDNTTQEQPLSLAVTDERSNCRSTRTSQTTVESNQHHTCRHTAAGPCLAPLGSLAGAP